MKGGKGSDDLDAVIKVLNSAQKGDTVLLNPQCAQSQQDANEEKLAKLLHHGGFL